MFSQPVATGSFSASCQEESEDKELQSSAGSCILHLGTELCRVLSFSAWLCGRSSSPLLCILNVLGDYFSAFHQTFGGFISLVNVHIEAVPCLVKAMLFLVQSVCPASSKNHPSVTADQEGLSWLHWEKLLSSQWPGQIRQNSSRESSCPCSTTEPCTPGPPVGRQGRTCPESTVLGILMDLIFWGFRNVYSFISFPGTVVYEQYM